MTPSTSTYSAFLNLLKGQEDGPISKPGELYAWHCGCTFIYAVGGWRTRRVCPAHAHLAEDPRQVVVRKEAV